MPRPVYVQNDTLRLKPYAFVCQLSRHYRLACTALSASIAIISMTMSHAHAAGLEYTKQSVLPFFEDGNYAEMTYAYVDPNAEGRDSNGQKIADVMDDFSITTGAIKIVPTPNTSLALIYDEPFGVDTIYASGNDFSNNMGTTEARVDTRSLTLLGGGKFNNNFWIYGGMEYQEAEGSVQLAQKFEGDPIAYDLNIKNKSNTQIPVLGFAYEIPEISLRANVTWRGEGEHSLKTHEDLRVDNPILNTVLNTTGATNYNDIPDSIKTGLDLPQVEFGDTNLSFNTPQSVNFDFQTGLSEKHQLLGMLNARWVEWTAFKIAPHGITEVVGEPLAEYKDDAYSVEVALGKQITPAFAGEIRAGYDSGTGEPISLLGPYDSIKSLAVGGKYDITDSLDLSAGVQYMWLEGGRAYSELPVEKTIKERELAQFDDGDGLAVGVKVGYHF